MDKQKSYKAVMIQSLILFATIMLMTTASAQAKTVIYKLTAVLDASDITYKKVNSADYDFNSGDILSARLYIDSAQPDLNPDTEIGIFENDTLDLSFTITSASGAVIYSSTTTTSNDIELKLEDILPQAVHRQQQVQRNQAANSWPSSAHPSSNTS